MKKETRAYNIRQSTFEDFDGTPQYYNLPMLIEYKGKKQVISAGNSDNLTVFRYGPDMAILSTNSGLGYAGLQIIDFKIFDDTDIQVFIQNTEELDLVKDFFEYSDSAQADILAQYMD